MGVLSGLAKSTEHPIRQVRLGLRIKAGPDLLWFGVLQSVQSC